MSNLSVRFTDITDNTWIFHNPAKQSEYLRVPAHSVQLVDESSARWEDVVRIAKQVRDAYTD